MSLTELKTDLQDELGRAKAALSLTDRLAGFVAALDRAGFTVETKTERVSGWCIEVKLIVDLPTELVDEPGPVVPEPAPVLPMPTANPVAVETRTVAWKNRGPAIGWTEDEDARLIALRVDNVPFKKIASEFFPTRTLAALEFRCKTVLRDRIAAARAAASKPDREAPAPEAVESPAEKHEQAPESPAQPKPDQEFALGFTAEQDDRLRIYMAADMGLGGAAALLKLPREKVAARWAQLQVTK